MQNQDDKKFAIVLVMIAIGIFMIGACLGFALTSMSYGQAFRNAEVRICTVQDLDYANLSVAYQQCKNKEQNFVLPTINITPLG